jgi:CRP-like cAMP-binding protein
MPIETDAKVKQHFSQFNLRKYPKGQILIHAGDAPQQIYYLVSGKVRQYDLSYRGDEIIVNVFKPGAFFPMLPALTKAPNQYFFDAETEIEVHLAPLDETVEFLKSNPDVLFDLLTRVYKGLDGILGRMFHLMSGSANSRILHELIIECRRFGVMNKDGSYNLSINEVELAGRAGLTRETVSREIQKVGRDGLIKVSRKGIVVTDLHAIERRLGVEV